MNVGIAVSFPGIFVSNFRYSVFAVRGEEPANVALYSSQPKYNSVSGQDEQHSKNNTLRTSRWEKVYSPVQYIEKPLPCVAHVV